MTVTSKKAPAAPLPRQSSVSPRPAAGSAAPAVEIAPTPAVVNPTTPESTSGFDRTRPPGQHVATEFSGFQGAASGAGGQLGFYAQEKARLKEEASASAELMLQQVDQCQEMWGFKDKLRSMSERCLADLVVRTRMVDFDGADDWSNFSLQKAGGKVFKHLDTKGGCYFHKDLQALVKDPRTKDFLDDLNSAFGIPDLPVDVWKIALHHAGSEAEATRWLAVLFQDLTAGGDGGHLVRIEDPEFRETLATAIAFVNLRGGEDQVQLYPGDTGKQIDRVPMYHYYVTAHLAQKMVADGTDSDLAFLAPMVLNTEYEYAFLQLDDRSNRADQGEKVGNKLKFAQRLADGLEKPLDELEISEDGIELTMQDLYLGYRGAHAGSRNSAPVLTYEAFRKKVRQGPEEAMEFIFRLAAQHD